MSDYHFNPLQMAMRPLYERAQKEDAEFAKEVKEKESRLEKPKSLAECAEYIMGEAYKYASEHKQGNFGLAGCDDEWLMGLIKHYYDEDDIVINKITNAKASVATTKDGKKADKKTEKKKEDVKHSNPLLDALRVRKEEKTDENGNRITTIKKGDQQMTLTELTLF